MSSWYCEHCKITVRHKNPHLKTKKHKNNISKGNTNYLSKQLVSSNNNSPEFDMVLNNLGSLRLKNELTRKEFNLALAFAITVQNSPIILKEKNNIDNILNVLNNGSFYKTIACHGKQLLLPDVNITKKNSWIHVFNNKNLKNLLLKLITIFNNDHYNRIRWNKRLINKFKKKKSKFVYIANNSRTNVELKNTKGVTLFIDETRRKNTHKIYPLEKKSIKIFSIGQITFQKIYPEIEHFEHDSDGYLTFNNNRISSISITRDYECLKKNSNLSTATWNISKQCFDSSNDGDIIIIDRDHEFFKFIPTWLL
jgi:hypothetical protein